MPQSNSQLDMQCAPVASHFAAKVHRESINSKLRHGMALHGQKSDTHTHTHTLSVSWDVRVRLQNSLFSVAFVIGP